MSQGRFIVLDGTEGCGKSTQTRLLHERLITLGKDAMLVRDPGTTAVGEKIRGILLDPASDIAMRCEMMLYMAARAQMMSAVVLPALQAGKTVISDRFVSSTLAYQLGGEAMTADEIRATAEVAIQKRWPDLTLILDMPPEASLARVKRAKDRIEQRPMEYHEQVRRNYRAQAAENPDRYRLVPATGNAGEVAERVWDAVRAMV